MTDDIVNWMRRLFRRPAPPEQWAFIPYSPHVFEGRRKQSAAIIVHCTGATDEQTKKAMIEIISKRMDGGNDA